MACGSDASGDGTNYSPGSRSVYHNTISAAEQPMSPLRSVRFHWTSGNSLKQLEVLSLALRKAFIWQWKYSTILLA